MQRLSLLLGTDWQAGDFSNTQLDYSTYVSAYAHPALVPARSVETWTSETGAQAVGATQPAEQVPAPAQPTLATATTGGALAPATYGYRVVARTANGGGTTASAEATIVVPAGTSTNTVTVGWVAPTVPAGGSAIDGYDVYGRTPGGELKLTPTPLPAGTTSFLDTGAATPAGALPAANTTSPYPAITPSNTQGQTSAAWVAADNFGVTTQAGDALSFSTTALQVTIQLAGVLAAGAGAAAGGGLSAARIRNGAVASIAVDGAVLYSVDTWGATPARTLYLDGNAHTIEIVHTGGYNAGIRPIGPIVATSGASVSSQLSATALFHPTFVNASWRVAATSATQYTLYRTLPGSAETTVASGLLTGTHYSGAGYVPGVDLSVATGTPLVAGDGATFTTDVTMLAVQSIALGSGEGAGLSTYTTPVYDLGARDTQYYAAEWLQSVPVASVTIATGDTPTPDNSWHTYTAPLSAAATSDGLAYGTAGLMAAPRSRYMQLTVTFGGVTIAPPWIRDLLIYAWVPERDPVTVRLGLGKDAVLGPNLTAYLGALATFTRDEYQGYLQLAAATSIGGATDAYLAGYLQDLGLDQVTGEQPETARARARAVLSNAAGALSLSGIATQVALLVTGSSGAGVTLSGPAATLLASCNGVTVQLGANGAYTVTIPPAPYLGMPGLPTGSPSTAGSAQAIIHDHITTTLRPIGGSPQIVFS